MSTRELVDEAKAAVRLGGLSRKTLQAWRYRRIGPRFYRLGGRVFYDQRDLDAFIEASRIEPTA